MFGIGDLFNEDKTLPGRYHIQVGSGKRPFGGKEHWVSLPPPNSAIGLFLRVKALSFSSL
jgi:hypothetical protein